MGLGLRLAFFAGVSIAGLVALVPDAVVEVLAGAAAVTFVGAAVVAWIRVLRSGRDIARRYVDQRLHAPPRGGRKREAW